MLRRDTNKVNFLPRAAARRNVSRGSGISSALSRKDNYGGDTMVLCDYLKEKIRFHNTIRKCPAEPKRDYILASLSFNN